jgi:hypothetical protein
MSQQSRVKDVTEAMAAWKDVPVVLTTAGRASLHISDDQADSAELDQRQK